MGLLSWLFGGKQNTTDRTARRDSIAIEVEPLPVEHFLPLAKEVIKRTGLVKPEWAPVIAELAADGQFGHSDSVALSYRKAGEPLSAAEKKALGLRANAALSREALEMLTEKGRERPLQALSIVLLNISNYSRIQEREIERPMSIGCTHYIWRTSRDNVTCDDCRKREGKKFRYQDAMRSFPGRCPTCTRDACRCYAEPIIPAKLYGRNR